MTTIPATGIYFASYEISVAAVSSILPFERNSIVIQSASGIPAQLMAGIIFTPIDIVKERLQVCFRGQAFAWLRFSLCILSQATKASFSQIISGVYINGGLKGFFRGYMTNVSLWAPYGALYLAFFRA